MNKAVLWGVVSTLLSPVFGGIAARDADHKNGSDARCSTKECAPKCPKPCNAPLEAGKCLLNPSVLPYLRCGTDMSLGVSLLWNRTATVLRDGGAAHHELKSHLGFQVDGALGLPHDNWEVKAHWRSLKSPYKLLPTTPSPDNDGEVRISEAWVTLGRPYYVSRWVSLDPVFGVKATKLHAIPVKTTGHKIDHKGFGPYVGIGSRFGFCRGFPLFSEVDFAVLYGVFEDDSIPSYVPSTIRTMQIGNPNVDVLFGLEHMHKFSKERYNFRAHIAWMQQWFGATAESELAGGTRNNFFTSTNSVQIGARLDF